MKLFVASSLLVAGFSSRARVAAAQVSPVSTDTISKRRERRLGKGLSSIDTTVGTASSNEPKTKSTTSTSVSDNLDVGILSNQEDTEFDEVFTWVDHDAPTRGRGGGRRRHGRKNGGRRHQQNQTLGRHKDKLLAKLHGSKVSHTNNDINVIDSGIMQMDIARVNNPITCDIINQGYVNCTNGIVEESGETCAEACGEDCCDEEDACTGFTGLICKDGYSCKGEASCFLASIGVVVNGCNGNEACLYAGYDGLIGAVRNGCVGTGACLYAASYGGSIEGIEDSCNGEGSCELAAAGFAEDDQVVFGGGAIGMIKSSCNEGDYVCYRLAYANGTVGDIVNSCEGKNACAFAASYGGIVEGIEDSCLEGEYSCTYAAAGFADDDGAYDPNDGGSIGMIESSCIGGNSSCYSLAFDGGAVGDVRDSCDDFYACSYAASYGGSIESITNSSCSGSEACSYAASCDAYENDNCKAGKIGNITNSCEEEKSCYKMADEGGYVNDVIMSCVGESSCERAAFNGSISLGIVNACRAERACEGLGEDSDIESQVNSCCNTKDECEGNDEASLPSECSMVTTQSPSKAPSSSPSKIPSSSPSMSPLSPTPSPTSPPSSAPTSAAPTVSLNPTHVMSSKSAKSKGRKSKQSKKSKTSKSAKALSMNLTTLDEDNPKIRRKRIRKHAQGASNKLSSLSESDEQ